MSFNHFTWSLFSNMTELLEAPVWPLTSPSNSVAFRWSTCSLQSLDNSLSTQSDSTQTHNKLNIHIFMQEMFQLEELKKRSKRIKEICKKEDKSSNQLLTSQNVYTVCVYSFYWQSEDIFSGPRNISACAYARVCAGLSHYPDELLQISSPPLFSGFTFLLFLLFCPSSIHPSSTLWHFLLLIDALML